MERRDQSAVMEALIMASNGLPRNRGCVHMALP